MTQAAICRKLRRTILTMRGVRMKCASLLCRHILHCGRRPSAGDADWPRYGGDDGKTRHSSLTQINRDNVAAAALGLEIRHRRKGRHPDAAHRGRAHAVRLHALAQDLRARCRQRQATVDSSIPASPAAARTAASCTGRRARTRACSRRSTISSTRWMPAPANPSTASARAAASTCAKNSGVIRPRNRCG